MKKVKDFFVADAHCDTLTTIKNSSELRKGKNHLDFERMLEYKKWLQVFAIWTSPREGYENILKNYNEAISSIYREANEFDKIKIITDKESLEEAHESKQIGALISVEGGEIIGDNLENIDKLYDDGIRAVTLTWNYTNKIGAGADEDDAKIGLSDFGRRVVYKLCEKKMITDVSHAAERTFWDVSEIVNCPIMASHSNSKSVCRHRRNLTDEQFLQIVGGGGYVGINFYPVFLSDSKKADILDIVRHIEHFASLGGVENIGLGGDFDGVDYLPEGIRGGEDVYKLADKLLSLNYGEDAVRNIMGENFYEFLKRCFC